MTSSLSTALPVRLAPHHIAFIDQARRHGAVSRAAVIRQLLDDAMARQTAAEAQP